VTYFDATAATTSEVDRASARILAAGMTEDDPVFLSTLTVSAETFSRRHPDVRVDSENVRVLRSVMMKPEHEAHVPWLINRITRLATPG
jgi:hypothetical protein